MRSGVPEMLGVSRHQLRTNVENSILAGTSLRVEQDCVAASLNGYGIANLLKAKGPLGNKKPFEENSGLIRAHGLDVVRDAIIKRENSVR